ncbi:hypothetical protein [Klebsiella aerogenes]|uniref:hypothetical protein n=1 Tax=Klebsiella aerogenes TaxID=548 RepID=UPI003314C3D5
MHDKGRQNKHQKSKKTIFIFKIIGLKARKCIALNGKTKSSPKTKIIIAIIINFIYYRHSVLNVCLPLFQPDASHPVFFTLLYVS